jgi:hypothetical protein
MDARKRKTGLQDYKRKEDSLPRSSLEEIPHGGRGGIGNLGATLRGASETNNTLLRFQPRLYCSNDTEP